MFCSAIQFLSGFFSHFWERLFRRHIGQREGTRRVCVLPRKANLNVRERPAIFSWIPSRRGCYHVRLVKNVLRFWLKNMDVDCTFLNFGHNTQKPFDDKFPSDRKVTIGISKPSFAKFVSDSVHPTDRLGRCPIIFLEQKPVLIMTHLASPFFPLGGTVFNFCLGTRLTAKACPLALKHSEFSSAKPEISISSELGVQIQNCLLVKCTPLNIASMNLKRYWH